MCADAKRYNPLDSGGSDARVTGDVPIVRLAQFPGPLVADATMSIFGRETCSLLMYVGPQASQRS